ncbi:hypothetical protein GCM10018771_20370 [Streptomyces cellulosae]|nr:hypothetical protein GCM10018771_20370 [Streptomyces cellulosae]
MSRLLGADAPAWTGIAIIALSRHTGYDVNITRAILQACAAVCKACGDECASHSGMEHCQICADRCRRCEQACNELLAKLG